MIGHPISYIPVFGVRSLLGCDGPSAAQEGRKAGRQARRREEVEGRLRVAGCAVRGAGGRMDGWMRGFCAHFGRRLAEPNCRTQPPELDKLSVVDATRFLFPFRPPRTERLVKSVSKSKTRVQVSVSQVK